jgi:hypothetical protein
MPNEDQQPTGQCAAAAWANVFYSSTHSQGDWLAPQPPAQCTDEPDVAFLPP